MSDDDVDFVLYLRPLKSFGSPAMNRLKRALKSLARSFGLRYYKVEYRRADGVAVGAEAADNSGHDGNDA